VVADARGYAFQRQRLGRWEPLAEGPVKPGAWADGVHPRLPGTRERVSFQFDPTGVAVPQQLQLARAGSDAAVRVIVQASGQVQVDAGAAAKLQTAGKSLLPIGMVAVSGEFSRGDVIAVRNPEGQEIARGLANYSSAEARLLCKHSSSEIAQVLGYSAEPEMLHRDNMVVLH